MEFRKNFMEDMNIFEKTFPRKKNLKRSSSRKKELEKI